jgi:5'-3' exonuclease
MQPLIDGDILLYEIGFAAEAGWQSAGFPSFDYVADLLDNRISNICAIVEATAPPIIYLTGPTNFRTEIAKRTPYKARPSLKPYHYHNIKAYIRCMYDSITSEGMEADDLMAIEQTRRPAEAIICTRDKDLRQVPGWTYSWELGGQPSFGPVYVESFGTLQLSEDRKKLSGTGLKFFYAQCLMGDSVDTIPGIPRMGKVGAYEILEGATTEREAYDRTLEAYRKVFGDDAETELLEQGRLLWMTRELHPDGKPVLWELPFGNENKE